jgi:hypothetical protein
MKKILYAFYILIFSCNHAKTKQEPILNSYPKLILDKKLESFYNQTKWMLYCKECDKQCILSDKVSLKDTTYFGFLDLKLYSTKFINDTTEINMAFYYNDSIKCDVNSVFHLGALSTGVVFKGKSSDSVIYFNNNSNVIFFINPKFVSSREVNPLQPDVIYFIKNNEDKLNPWFREEAKRRKVIE